MKNNEKIDISLIIYVISFFVFFSLLIFIITLGIFYNDANYLSGIGQMFGSLFSFWALIGLVGSQILQLRALSLQQESSKVQAEAMSAQLQSVKDTSAALSLEMLQSALERASDSFERHAKTLIRTSANINDALKRRILDTAAQSDDKYQYCKSLVDNDSAIECIKLDISDGTSKLISDSYSALFVSLRTRSLQLHQETGRLDLFRIQFDNTPVSHLFFCINEAE